MKKYKIIVMSLYMIILVVGLLFDNIIYSKLPNLHHLANPVFLFGVSTLTITLNLIFRKEKKRINYNSIIAVSTMFAFVGISLAMKYKLL